MMQITWVSKSSLKHLVRQWWLIAFSILALLAGLWGTFMRPADGDGRYVTNAELRMAFEDERARRDRDNADVKRTQAEEIRLVRDLLGNVLALRQEHHREMQARAQERRR